MFKHLLKKLLKLLGFVLAPVLIVLAVIVKLVISPFEKPINRTREEVAAILQRRLSDAPDWNEWDDFICIPIADPNLETIRKECLVLEQRGDSAEAPSFLSAEAIERYRTLVTELRTA